MPNTVIVPDRRDAIPPEIMGMLRGPRVDWDRVDIAKLNLLCAKGLPRTEHLDIEYCLRRIDQMVEATRQVTQRDIFDRYSGKWDHSWAIARVHAMICTLQRGFGVRYNPAKIPLHVPLEANDSFLHGIIQGEGGVCSSLPVLYAAVGRRLGYPIKLVKAKVIHGWGHCFARWEEPRGERFNIEVNNESFESPHDEHYRNLPYNWRPEWEKWGLMLKSLTPREELASFLKERAGCWKDDGKDSRRQVETMAWAYALVPYNLEYQGFLERFLKEWDEELRKQKPARFPKVQVVDWKRRYPPTLPVKAEQEIFMKTITEFLLKDPINNERWWEPMRRARSVRDWPTHVEVRCVGEGFRVNMFVCATV